MHTRPTFVASSLVPSTRREAQAPTSAPMNAKRCTKLCLAFHRKAYYPVDPLFVLLRSSSIQQGCMCADVASRIRGKPL
ncbi:hypothetical protein H257_16037 [Aphanomyces astaci]|uniref:Uncharacterized protein n=1 Tax=Aphanomyces astaci TaxID=112090 RepID=W4FM61_APHAT|nr:hypothetical protein H257_16037 [Aphanomyces astaci]ETV67914.1 hypothetical protein H257_16037 [Aphanomyces astaci]|eukprot:XP_009842659.1 hypothetical protein H257_16037 [Aphanomyces astaci]